MTRILAFLAAVALAILTGLAAMPVNSAPQCDTRETVIALLAERYGETRRMVGLAGQAAVMELYASDATGTWSITMTLPDGLMCLMASGSNFEAVTESLPPAGIDG